LERTCVRPDAEVGRAEAGRAEDGRLGREGMGSSGTSPVLWILCLSPLSSLFRAICDAPSRGQRLSRDGRAHPAGTYTPPSIVRWRPASCPASWHDLACQSPVWTPDFGNCAARAGHASSHTRGHEHPMNFVRACTSADGQATRPKERGWLGRHPVHGRCTVHVPWQVVCAVGRLHDNTAVGIRSTQALRAFVRPGGSSADDVAIRVYTSPWKDGCRTSGRTCAKVRHARYVCALGDDAGGGGLGRLVKLSTQ
jgi:hypothetical protein